MTTSVRPSEAVVQERLHRLLLRLMQGDAPSAELEAIVREHSKEQERDLSKASARKMLEKDRKRLREGYLGCEIVYNRGEDTYRLTGLNCPLIDLPPEALHGLAFLQATFSASDTPMNSEVRALLDHITGLLPRERRRILKREQRAQLQVDLRQRDNEIMVDVWEAVQRACREHRLLTFDYVAPKRGDGLPRMHTVEPDRIYFDTAHKHYYLGCFWLESRGPKTYQMNQAQVFRLGRMRNPHVLEKHFIPNSRRIKQYELVYELSAEVARLGVTEHFPNSRIIRHEDGSATVYTASANLFFDLRTLLHYGGNCRVIGGDEAVREMEKLVEAIYRRYHEPRG